MNSENHSKETGAGYRNVALPLTGEDAASLKAGDACKLSGPMYTLRDAGHIRLIAELEERGSLPYGLSGQTIFYAGPTPPAAGRPFGAVGPTTASRMDFAAPICIGRASRPPSARASARQRCMRPARRPVPFILWRAAALPRFWRAAWKVRKP